jgi:NAD(P)-dependent dehydrogenase (short-subunit alcohol dehydrogenase family)
MTLSNHLACSASKAGIDAMIRAVAVALASFGVPASSVASGMMDNATQLITEWQLAAIDGRDGIAALLDERTTQIPVGRRTDVVWTQRREWSSGR